MQIINNKTKKCFKVLSEIVESNTFWSVNANLWPRLYFLEVLDINMMLIGGFGFLMTFLKRHGFSSLGLTFMIVVFVTEWSILLSGFIKMDSNFTIPLTMMRY